MFCTYTECSYSNELAKSYSEYYAIFQRFRKKCIQNMYSKHLVYKTFEKQKEGRMEMRRFERINTIVLNKQR